MHPRHYSPQTALLLIENGAVPDSGIGAYLQLRNPPGGEVREVVFMPSDAEEYASQLYRILHELDTRKYDWIAVDAPPDAPDWQAVRDRLQRAATLEPET
jgi:L-threonylcarbamoyladenylate synthase